MKIIGISVHLGRREKGKESKPRFHQMLFSPWYSSLAARNLLLLFFSSSL
jgi:hypothetical protein